MQSENAERLSRTVTLAHLQMLLQVKQALLWVTVLQVRHAQVVVCISHSMCVVQLSVMLNGLLKHWNGLWNMSTLVNVWLTCV